MAIPKSTIVMAALTCIPLGLAVRDYVKHGKTNPPPRDPYAEDTEIDTEDHQPSAAELAAEAKREEVREEERKAARQHAFEQLLGSSPATLGSAFGKLQLGMTEAMFDNHYDETSALRALGRDNDLLVQLDPSDGVLDSVSITPNANGDADAICEALTEYVSARWSGATAVGDAKVWAPQDSAIRAELTSDDACTLTFRSSVPADQWIQKLRSPFPFWAIGQSSANLVKSIEPKRADLSDAPDSIRWTTVGVGAGVGSPKVHAFAKDGKVVAVLADMQVHADTASAIEASLDKLLGKHTTDPDMGASVWAKKPTARFECTDGECLLTVGTIPEE